jgi:hypothetical protein
MTPRRRLIWEGNLAQAVRWERSAVRRRPRFRFAKLHDDSSRCHRFVAGPTLLGVTSTTSNTPISTRERRLQRDSIDQHGPARLPPRISELRAVSVGVATAVAREAQAEGVAPPCSVEALDARIHAYIREPHCRPYPKVD